jgi:hypothetical protein
MADSRLPLVVRIETRRIPMRRVVAAVVQAFSAEELALDIAEIAPQNLDRKHLVERIKSIVDGVVATAKVEKNAILCVHTAISPLMFVYRGEDTRTVDVAILAAVGPFSPLHLFVRANPSTKLTDKESAVIRRYEEQMRAEMPTYKMAKWQEGIELRNAVSQRIFDTLFQVADKGLTGSDDSLQ